MSMLDNSCKSFISVLASKAPVPGGGGAAALGGTIGMALSNMVGNLTTGKKKYADVEPEINDLIKRGDKIIEELQNLVDKDAEVFEPLSKAYGLPKNTPEEIKYKDVCIEDCSKLACSVPIEIMRKSFEGIKIHARMAQIGTAIAISDVGCGVVFLKSALIAASLNIVINLNTIKDKDFIAKMRKEMDTLIREGSKMADETFDFVINKLKK
jgi:methenyltetrahydrofolate cyclohydrolase